MKGASILMTILLIELLVCGIGPASAGAAEKAEQEEASSQATGTEDAGRPTASKDAEETTGEAAENEEAESEAAESKEAEATETPRDRYALPEGSVEELQKFVEELQAYRPQNAQEYYEHRQKSPRALQAAAEKILALETDETSAAYKAAKVLLLESLVQGIADVELEEKKKILRELTEALKKKGTPELTKSDLSLAMSAARSLESGNAAVLAAEAYESFAELFGASDDAQLSDYGKRLVGAARRLRLPGNELELKGSLLGGGEFDWNSYRGKVVLVDFWATWCGPCIAELPNVKTNYALYHDKGFDVVGISLDNSRTALESFLDKDPLPWVTLFDEKSGGWSHPMATYYGVSGIPTVLLVDKEGKVLSLRARGEELGRLLEEQLGPVDDEKRREVEAQLARAAPQAMRLTAEPAEMERAAEDVLGEGHAIYLACGEVGGRGKVVQVDARGRVLGSIDVEATPYGIDVLGDNLVIACPQGSVAKIAEDGSESAVPGAKIDHPIDVAADPQSGNLLVADNVDDVLVRVGAGDTPQSETLQKFEGSGGHAQNMGVAISYDGKVLFATNEPQGVYRFSADENAGLGDPIIDEDGDVAADRSSDRWAAFTRSGIRMYAGEDQIGVVALPKGRSPYRGGIVAFGPNDKLVVALASAGGPELAVVDVGEKKIESLFKWDRDRVVDFVVGPRWSWSDKGETRASHEVAATSGREASGGAAKARVSDESGNELAIVSVDPPLPHVFEPGERLTVRFTYKLNSADSCHIFVRPFTDGRHTPGYAAHGSPGHPRGEGEGSGWFELTRPGRIDEVRVQMVTDDADALSADRELFIEADAEWK